MYEGAPDYPDKDIWWELIERYERDDLLHRADRDPRVHEVGRRVPRASTTCQLAAPARHGRRADQPEGVALVPQGDRRRALPDRRHVVADGDRRDHDHARCRGSRTTKPGSAGKPLPGIEAAVVDREGRRGRGHRPGPADAAQAVAVDAAHALQGGRPVRRDLLVASSASDVYFVGDAARRDEDGYFWVIGRVDDVINVSGHRLSTAEVESAIVSHAKVAEAAVIGQQDEDTGQAIAAFVTLAGDLRGRRRDGRRDPRARGAARSASSRGRSGSSGPTTCRRRARARSCAACCATSPRAASWAT